jgi:hypothetical protein
VQFFETSHKKDINVEESFLTLATEVYGRLIMDGPVGAVNDITVDRANATELHPWLCDMRLHNGYDVFRSYRGEQTMNLWSFFVIDC